MRRFEGRTVIVTGGGASLGRCVAMELASDGANVVVADHNGAAAKVVCEEILRRGESASAETVDVTDSLKFERLVDQVVARYGAIHGLVNNAGMLGPVKALLETDEDEIERVFALNVAAVFSCTKAVAARMKGGASIVSLASLAGKEGPKNLSIYSASKAAVIVATKSWSKELIEQGIRINCVAPTLVDSTGMKSEMPQSFSSDSISRIPMGRAATAQEVTNVITFLLSDEASFVTGACYDVSGGRASY